MNSFDEIMKYCPYLKELIENKINEEVEKAKAERQQEISSLKATLDSLVINSLGGDV